MEQEVLSADYSSEGIRTLDPDLKEKFVSLINWFKAYRRVLVAYSGGVDSSLLAAAAKIALGDGAGALTSSTPTFDASELKEAVEVANSIGVRHIVIDRKDLGNPGIAENNTMRCYFCRSDLVKDLKAIMDKEGFDVLVDGTVLDDLKGYRPGIAALREGGVRSPLVDIGFSKAEVRALARALKLPNADKPSNACLASRVPYGEGITLEKLERIEKAERVVRDLTGARQVRVRDHGHGEIARIEVGSEERNLLLKEHILDEIGEKLKALGFKYVAFDVMGYRTGSMDEVLRKRKSLQ